MYKRFYAKIDSFRWEKTSFNSPSPSPEMNSRVNIMLFNYDWRLTAFGSITRKLLFNNTKR